MLKLCLDLETTSAVIAYQDLLGILTPSLAAVSLASSPAPSGQFPCTKLCPSKEAVCVLSSACSFCGIRGHREPLLGQREDAHRMGGVLCSGSIYCSQ